MKNVLYLPMYIAFFLLINCDGMAASSGEKASNVGQDFTRPLSLIDLRWTYQNRVAKQEYHDLTLRLEKPFRLSEQWTLNTRFDLPVVHKNLPGLGQETWGVGDIDFQAGLIRKLNDRYSVGGGARAIFPSASEKRFGTGKYRLLVGGGFRAMLSEISAGSFIAPQVQYDFDIAGDDVGPYISTLRILPTFHLSLSHGQFVTLLSTGDMRYNFNSNTWFVPVDVTYGKRWGNVIGSIQASYPIVDDSKLYEFKTMLRVGYFF